MLAQAAGCTQPVAELAVEDFFFDDPLDATLTWQQCGITETFGFQNYSDINWTTGETVAAVMPSHGVPLSTAMNTTMTLVPPTTTLPLTDVGAYAQGFFHHTTRLPYLPLQYPVKVAICGLPIFVLTWSKALIDIASLPSPQSNGTGIGFLPFPTLGPTPSYFPQPSLSGLSIPQLNIAGVWDPNHIIGAPPTFFMGGSDFVGLQLEILDSLSTSLTSSEPLEYTKHIDQLVTPTVALSTLVNREMAPSSSLRKRSRRRDEGEASALKKRGRLSVTRVPGGAQSTERTRRSPATRTRSMINDKSKAAGYGAERLTSTAAQGVHHRSLPGLSVPQGSMGALLQEQPSWIEEREQVETWHNSGSSVPLQSAENAEGGECLHKIPTNLTEREGLMLQTTQADEERGAVRDIMCRVCSGKQFNKWVAFQRHCKSCEKHPSPSEVKFCSKSGDDFGRQDSEVRHKDKRHQEACLSTSQDEAREKEQKVKRVLKAFEARLQHCPRSGEDPGPRFSDVMSRKLTNTSKKLSKAETWSEGKSWATGLC
ncbi:hypothetical protein H4582DRAFT_1909563 [Lactarius indigo]|nr:hypothetical protein H4582DRAFT_1909563 [Lactarius indigo]